MARKHKLSKPAPVDPSVPVDKTADHPADQPIFAQPTATVDPTGFRIQHASDSQAYKTLDGLNKQNGLQPLPFPAPRGGTEPRLTLAQIWGNQGDELLKSVTKAGRLVFHAVGDTGNTRGPDPQNLVADKMVSDFDETNPADIPRFFFHLGDVVYSFGEANYYYDQFYEPYRNYPAPILALAGNHDGMVAPDTQAVPLEAYLANFCEEHFTITPQAGGLSRTAQIQPGVFFTFEAPFVRILTLYSNVLEDPGVISSQDGAYAGLTDMQLDFLAAALKRVKSEKFSGAVIFAHHHPSFTAGSRHGWSIAMQAEIDAICEQTGVWPHAVLSAHAHNYQRFTRAHGNRQIPYIIAGNGGHAISHLTKRGDVPLRVPTVIQAASGHNDSVTLESYDDQDYGYLRVIVTQTQLRIEYHPATDGAQAKTPDDSVTIDLAGRNIVHFTG
jgi:hypothetical protein